MLEMQACCKSILSTGFCHREIYFNYFYQFYFYNWENAFEVDVFCLFILPGLDCWWAWRRLRAVCCVSMTWDCHGWSKLLLYQAG